MADRQKKYHPALKHAGFSAATILPGESADEFDKLHRDLIAELNPNGALEDDIVKSIAHHLWRKKNLATFRTAELAHLRRSQIWAEKVPNGGKDLIFPLPGAFDPADHAVAIRNADEQAREELGEAYELIEIGATATMDQLAKDLEIQDRLYAMIDKCLKRLLFLRGLKSISKSSDSVAPKRLAAPKAA